jgi:hypothetical protein
MLSAWKNRKTRHELFPDCWCDDRYSNWHPLNARQKLYHLSWLVQSFQRNDSNDYRIDIQYTSTSNCGVLAVTKLVSVWIDGRTDTVLTNQCLLKFCCVLVDVVACLMASLLQSNHIDRLVSNSPSHLSPILTCGTPWSWVLLDNHIVAQLLEKVLAFYGIHVYKRPPLIWILSAYISQTYFLNVQFNIIQSTPRSS